MDREFTFPQDDELCPRCRYGRIRSNPQPYVRVFRGHVFSVPDAICLTCDVCDYCEYEALVIGIMGKMISVAQNTIHQATPEAKSQPTAATSLLPDDADSQNATHQANPS